MYGKTREFLATLPELGQGTQQISFLFFFFVLLRDLRGCNEAQHSRWTFYEVVKVKIAVIEDNMDIRRFNVLKEEDLKRLNEYLRAWKYLTKEGN